MKELKLTINQEILDLLNNFPDKNYLKIVKIQVVFNKHFKNTKLPATTKNQF